MAQEHAQHRTRRHYWLLGANLLISTVIMYFVMFTMIWSTADLFHNLNTFYMALMMATPMGVLMLALMGSMYGNAKLNAVLYAAFALVFALSFYAMRDQSLIGDKQFLSSMIPHHSGAILMCERAAIEDAEIRSLCAGIIESQTREIGQMKQMLANR